MLTTASSGWAQTHKSSFTDLTSDESGNYYTLLSQTNATSYKTDGWLNYINPSDGSAVSSLSGGSASYTLNPANDEVCTSTSLSAYKVGSAKGMAFYVTGVSAIKIYAQVGSAGRHVQVKVNNGEAYKLIDGTIAGCYSGEISLTPTENNSILVYGTGDIYLYAIKVTPASSAPTLVGASSSPAASATNVAVSGTGFLKFSKNLSSIDGSKITISPSSNGEALSSIAKDGTDASKVNYTWSGLQKNNEYTINVAANAVSDGTDGNAATSLSFTTVGKTALTGTWSNANPTFENGAASPTIPTFSVTGGGTAGTDFTVAYNLVSGSNVTVDGSTGITAIDTNTAGTSVVRATVSVSNTEDYTISPTTYDCTITVNAAAVPLTAVSNQTWNFASTSPSWTTKTSNNDTYVENNLEIANGAVLTASDGSKPQRLMLKDQGTSTQYYAHFKVAANSKITVNAVGGSSRNIKITKGNFAGTGTGAVLMEPTSCGSTAKDYIVQNTGDGEQDIYVYNSSSGNITLYSITVEPAAAITTYSITKGSESNGTFSINKTSAAAGESVTVTTTPATGYEVGSVTTTPSTSVATTTLNTTYTFTMPASDVTVNVNFTPQAAPALAISTQPVGASYNQGATATALTVAASNGTTPYAYQWYRNTSSSTSSGTAIDGETNASYTPSTGTVGTTYYYCKVTDAASATVTSTAVAITVKGAAENEPSSPATTTYASKTFLDVSGTKANGELEDGSKDFLSYGTYYLTHTMKPAWMTDNKYGESSSGYSYSNAVKQGYLNVGSSSSVSTGYGIVKLRASKQVDFYVTGTTGVAILGKGANSTKRIQLAVQEVDSNGNLTSVGSIADNGENSVTNIEHLSTLDASKFYKVTVDATTADNAELYQIRFTKSSATPVETYAVNVPGTTELENGSISSNVSMAAAGATVTITGNPSTGYRLNTVTVTKNGGSTTTPVSGTGNSRSFTMPAYAVDVTATFVALPTITTSATNGTVTTSPASYAAEGTTVTITATPATNYALDAITVTDANDNAITVENNQFTMPNSNVTVSATFVAQQVSAGDRWNFTTMNSADMALYDASSDWNNTTSSSRAIYGNAFSASKGSYASNTTTAIEQIYGMEFGRMSGGSLSGNAIKIFKPTTTTATDGFLQLDASSLSVKLPILDANTELTVYYSGSSTKGFELGNATVKEDGATKIIGENASATIKVTSGSEHVVLTTESSGFKIYKIVVGDVVTVSAPTITNPADGTGYDGTTDLSPTVTTTQAAGDGTVTTYWAYSTAAMTRAQIVAANNGFTTNTATATITAADVNERTMVLNAVTKYEKGGNTYYSDIVTATYPYTGTRTSNLTVDNLDIQRGEERTLKPVFKFNDGTVFDPTDDGNEHHTSIFDFFDFTFEKTTNVSPYVSVDANGVVKTKDASGNQAAEGTTETFRITATKKSGWNDATTADGPWPFDQTSYSTTADITVIKKETGFHMTFYWDPEYKQQVDPSEYSLGTGDESSVTIFSEKIYNGRMIYAKPDDGYTIYVAAGIKSGSVSNVSSNSKKDGVNYYKYTYNDPTDEYPDVPIEFNGMPILIEDTEWGSSDTEKFFYLNVHTYNNSTKTFEGSPIKAKFTVLNNNSRRPNVTSSAISLKPETNADPLSTAQTVAVVGAEGAYVYGKFSSSSTYSTPNLINEKGVLGGVSSVAVFSTEVAGRKISATQVKQYSDGEYYIGGQVNLTYTYRFATELNLSSNSYYTNVTPSTKEMSEAATINLNDFIQSITYYNKDEKKDIEITSTVSNKAVTGVDEDLEKTQKETVTYEVAYRNGADGTGETDATRTTVDNNGIVTIGKHSGQVIITMTYPGGTYEKKVNGRTGVTATTSETFTIYLTDPSEQIPNITPTTRNFTDEQAVRVQAPTDWNTLYMIQTPTYASTDTEHKNPIYDDVTYISSGEQKNCFLLEKGEFVMLTLTESARVRAFAYNQNEFTENNEPTSTGTNTSKEVYETYTKLAALQAPVLSPSGNPHVRTTKDLTVNVTLKDAIAGLEVYYTTDGTDPTTTTGQLFNGSEKIKISGASTTVKAIAYDPATGRISPITTGVYVYTGNITQPKFYVKPDGGNWDEGHIEGTVVVGPNDRVKIEGPAGSTLYYTLDGSTPTPGASREYDVNDTSAPFLIMKNTTGRALAILDDASSPVTTVEFVLESDQENNLWEAVEETTPGGKMANTDRYVVYGKSTGNSSTKAVKYLTATFGGMDNTGWGHADISESTKGTPLDGVGSYSIRNVIDAWDESGKEPKNSSTLLHERTFKLPAQGDMVRFEPERDGQLTIWLLQQGGLNYTDDGEFCDAFMRLRPVYLFDEQGNSIPVSENRGIKSSTRLSSNWDELQGVGKWTEKGEKQLGVTNIYYTKEESNKIYAMYNTYLDGKGAGDAIEPFEVPDGDVKTMLSNLGLTGHGYVMPSGGYVRYNFDVKGGKSYYLFGFRTKLGVRGFRFQPTNVEVAKSVTVADNTADIVATIKAGETGGTIATDEICNVTYTRKFTNGKWAGVVFPFSVSFAQMKKVFGDLVDVVHLESVNNDNINLKRHWYPMIVAGTPVLIKPSKDMGASVTFEGVRIEAESVTELAPAGSTYKMTGTFTPSTIGHGCYYISGGALSYRSASTAANTNACRSWLTPVDGQARPDLRMFTADAFGADEWNVAGNPQPFVQKEDVVTYINGVEEDGIIQTNKPANVYTISGQLVRKNSTSLEGLPKGIYIVNGKKVAIK